MCVSGTAPWLSDLQHVADIASSQYSELRTVCQHLQQQNESLRKLVKQLVYEKDHAACDLGMQAQSPQQILLISMLHLPLGLH